MYSAFYDCVRFKVSHTVRKYHTSRLRIHGILACVSTSSHVAFLTVIIKDVAITIHIAWRNLRLQHIGMVLESK